MRKIIEIWFWFKIFLSPVFGAILIIIILSFLSQFHLAYLLLFIPAVFFGVVIAENARKKHGTSNYYSSLMNTPDIKETWEIEAEIELKKELEKELEKRNSKDSEG